MGLKGEMALRLVGSLSGGEKARVALACFVLTPQNVLILDEPSNHLDVDTVAALAGGLNAFEGAIVVISHDRAFVEELRPTHVLTVADGAATLEKRELVEAKREWSEATRAYKAARRRVKAARHDVHKTRKAVRIEYR